MNENAAQAFFAGQTGENGIRNAYRDIV